MSDTGALTPQTRTYRQHIWLRLVVSVIPVIGLVVLLSTVDGDPAALFRLRRLDLEQTPLLLSGLVGGLVILGVGLVAVIGAWRAKITLRDGTIEQISWLTHRRLTAAQIEGYRLRVVCGPEGNSEVTAVVPIDKRLDEIAFDESYDFDDVFWRWLYALPDLDAQDREYLQTN